jgi:hypothetical protein
MKFYLWGLICFVPGLFVNVVNASDSTVMVSDAWIREAPPNTSSLAGYMVIKNHSNKNQTLLSASSSAFAMVMIHRSEQKNGMAHMTHQKQVVIPAKAKITFAPGGYHLMLMKPKQPLKAGAHVTVSLVFANEKILRVNFKVRKDMPVKDAKVMKHNHHNGMK